MSALQEPEPLSVEAYLELERAADFKSEFIAGEVFAMAGTTLNHNRIQQNVNLAIGNAFRDRPCEIFVNDIKIRDDAADAFFYPDLSGLCEEPALFDSDKGIYTNPKFIIEILSDSTEAYDRGQKFLYYQSIESLEEYILISQSRLCAERYRKNGGGTWRYESMTSLEDVLELSSVETSIPLSEIYRNIEFA